MARTVPRRRIACDCGAVVHVVAYQLVAAENLFGGDEAAERYHLAFVVGEAQLHDAFDDLLALFAGSHLDLPYASKENEIVYIYSTHVVAERGEYGTDVKPHGCCLVAVDIQEVLRYVGFERTVYRGYCTLFAYVVREGVKSFLHLGKTQCLAVLKLHLQTSHVAYAGYRRRNECKALCLGNPKVCLLVEPVDNGGCRLALLLAQAPVLENDEYAGGVALLAAVEYAEPADGYVGLDLGILRNDALNLPRYLLGARERGCGRKLYAYDEIAVILIGYECGGPDSEHVYGKCDHDAEAYGCNPCAAQQETDASVESSLQCIISLVEPSEEPALLSPFCGA